MTQPPDRFELEPVAGDFAPEPDNRPRMPEPLPVRLVAVDDVRMLLPAGFDEAALDAFYVGLLGFARHGDLERLTYRAENFSLTFDVIEPPLRRGDMRPLGVEVPSLADLELKLIEAEAEYSRRRGLLPGEEAIVMLDPAGNWLEIIDRRGI